VGAVVSIAFKPEQVRQLQVFRGRAAAAVGRHLRSSPTARSDARENSNAREIPNSAEIRILQKISTRAIGNVA
jgi:hypothetical protein